MTPVEYRDGRGTLLAMLIPHALSSRARLAPGIQFYTTAEQPLQLGGIRYPAGHVIPAHRHEPIPRKVDATAEVLILKRGRLRVDLYGADCWAPIAPGDSEVFANAGDSQTFILETGDILLLLAGGHGFQVLEEVELWEVKTGPYLGEADKERLANDGA